MNTELVPFFYGNPLLYQKEMMSSQTLNVLVDKIRSEDSDTWNKWIMNNPPHPFSEEVKQDLFEIAKAIEKQTPEDVAFIDAADKNKELLFQNLLKENQIEVEMQFLKNITYYLDPLTFKLKYHFNYPRPYQVAYAMSIPMYPSKSTDACSPAYPSGHAIDSMAIGCILSQIYPSHEKSIMDLAYRISESRYISGIHFSFDKKFGEEIGLYIGENYSTFLIELSSR
jgi:hypothetical protein